MRVIQCAALFLPLFLCADPPKGLSTDDKVQIQLHNDKTHITYLKPLELKNKDKLPDGLLLYGFIINTDSVYSRTIKVKNQEINIPKNTKALLLTLSKDQGEEFCQDIKLTPFTLKLPEFKDVMLKEYHAPIYLQFAEPPVQAEQGRKQDSRHHTEKEENISDNQSPAGVSSSESENNLVQTKHGQKKNHNSRQNENEDHSPEKLIPAATIKSKRKAELRIARTLFRDNPTLCVQ